MIFWILCESQKIIFSSGDVWQTSGWYFWNPEAFFDNIGIGEFWRDPDKKPSFPYSGYQLWFLLIIIIFLILQFLSASKGYFVHPVVLQECQHTFCHTVSVLNLKKSSWKLITNEQLSVHFKSFRRRISLSRVWDAHSSNWTWKVPFKRWNS